MTEWTSWIDGVRLRSGVRRCLEAVGLVLLWSIWMFRNNMLFNQVKPIKAVLWDQVQAQSFLWISSRTSKFNTWHHEINLRGKVKFDLLDVNNLVLSVVSSCAEGSVELNVCDDDLLKSHIQFLVGKLHVWMLKTLPINLPECLVQFVYSRLSNSSPKQTLHQSKIMHGFSSWQRRS
ncbi:hypothetical protein LXL04_004733 [Taraxacum kok-saghyz]